MNNYMTVETTNLIGSVNYSLQSTNDVQNGAVIGKGALVTGESMIYTALDDYTNGMYLVANPAWDYDTCRAVNQNEENYVNKAGVPFRTYKLEKDHTYTISNVPTEFEKGDFLEFKNGANAKATSDTKLKVIDVYEVGFPFCVGSAGTPVAGDTTNEYGYAIGQKTKKYVVEVQ